MAKIQPNDPCPCGSGKKYKKCCGANSMLKNKSVGSSNLFLDDFVIENLNTDCVYLVNAMQMYLGPDGFREFSDNADWYHEKYENDEIREWLSSVGYKGISNLASVEKERGPLYIRPYGGEIPEKQNDIISLCKDGLICKKGCQVEIFHAALMENLINRFDDYYYRPSGEAAKYQSFGAFAHRGFDFLLGITLYLELQLGVHVYFDKEKIHGYFKMNDSSETDSKAIRKEKSVNPSMGVPVEHSGLKTLMNDYSSVINIIKNKYDPVSEVELYKAIGAYHSEEEYKERRDMIKPGFLKELTGVIDFNYIEYLKNLVMGICLNDGHWRLIVESFPQCDLAKYLIGLEHLSAVFGKYKVEGMTDIEQYHRAVFNFMDELNGFSYSILPHPYEDFVQINEDEFKMKDGKRLNNPARKSTSPFPVRKLRMRIFDVVNGKSLSLLYVDKEGKWKTIGKYPILPWICNEGIEMFHTNPFDGKKRKLEDLFSDDVLRRQDYLNIEFRIGKKPQVNRIEEYLDPEVYYDWLNSKELKRIRIETEELREECNRLRDTMGSIEEGFKYEYEEKINDINNKYEEKAEEIRRNAEHSAVGANYNKIKADVDNSLLQYEQEIQTLLGISRPLLSKLDNKKIKLSNELKKQIYTSELTFRLLTEASVTNEPIDVTISVLPLTKSIELVLKALYDRISGNELEDFSQSKFNDPINFRMVYFDKNSQKKKDKIEMWALTQLFNDKNLCANWDQWWNRNSQYVDLSLLEKLSGKIILPQLEDGQFKSSASVSFQTNEDENRKILYQALNYIRERYRNPISHTTKLKKPDYEKCRNILISGQKLFWILLAIIK